MNDEHKIEPAPKVYEAEHKYQQLRMAHDRSFDQLVSTVPEEQGELRRSFQDLYNTEPDKLLDPDKLRILKGENPALYGEVSRYYMDFLKHTLGLD